MAGSCRSCSEAMRRDPPAARIPQISYTDRSKDRAVTNKIRSLARTRNRSFTHLTRLTAERWLTAMAFGLPDVPEVNMT